MGDLDLKSSPASLVVTVAGAAPKTYTLLRERITLGRSEDNDIVISSPIVSRHHAQLERVPGGYQLVVLPEVSNTMVCAGKPVTGQRRLHHGDILRLDSEIPGLMVTLVYQSPSEADAAARMQTITFDTKEKLTFGRDPGSDVKLSGLSRVFPE
jgi:pSer/pThr/pTyr-binding forkhead associated (FHA) protein